MKKFLLFLIGGASIGVSAQTVIILPEYQSARGFNEGLAAVNKNSKWGFIDTDGNVVVGFNFDDARDFNEGLAAVKVDKAWGYIDKSGKVVIEPKFVDARDFGQGLAPVRTIGPSSYKVNSGYSAEDDSFHLRSSYDKDYKNDQEWVYIDRRGIQAIRQSYWDARTFGATGIAPVSVGDSVIYIDTNGRYVANPAKQAEHMHRVNFNLFPDRDELFAEWGFRGRNGAWVIEPKYSEVTTFDCGIAIASDYGYDCVIDTTGIVLYKAKEKLYLLGNGYVLEQQRGAGIEAANEKNFWHKVFYKSDFTKPIYESTTDQNILFDTRYYWGHDNVNFELFPSRNNGYTVSVSEKGGYIDNLQRVDVKHNYDVSEFRNPSSGLWVAEYIENGGRYTRRYGFSALNMSDMVREQVKGRMQGWLQKAEFESIDDYKTRTHGGKAQSQMVLYADEIVNNIIERGTDNWKLSDYDADNQTFVIETDLGNYVIYVPRHVAPSFKSNFKSMAKRVTFGYENGLRLQTIDFVAGNQNFLTCELDPSLLYNGNDINVNLLKEGLAINILQQDNGGKSAHRVVTPSDVDIDIPINKADNDMTFVVVLSCERYQQVDDVPYAAHDGEVFAQYAQHTLGVPKLNIHEVNNATLSDIRFHLNWLAKTLDAYDGEARGIVYYAGHGVPDPKTAHGYLLPTDGYPGDLGTTFPLAAVNKLLSQCNAQSVLVITDACFSGAARDNNGGMLSQGTRGVAIKMNEDTPEGNVVMFSATLDDQTAYPLDDKCHGLFTYFLLKALKDSKGDITLGDLVDRVTTNVRREAMRTISREQTPSVRPSTAMSDCWRNIKLR